MKYNKNLKEIASKLPLLPGCYFYKDENGEILYIGKAKILRNRVTSYFNNFEKLEPRIQLMLTKAKTIDHITVDSEAEALIAETNLIKKYKPFFNRLMIDDKNYCYIRVSYSEDFPKIKIVRTIKNGCKDKFFGPYPQSFPAKDVIRRLRKIYPYRTCNRKMYEEDGKVICNDPKPCLYYHLGLCKAPCANHITKKDYRKSINDISKFLNGNKSEITKELEARLSIYSKNLEYEKASVIRDRLNNIKYVLTKVRVENDVEDVLAQEIRTQQKSNAVSNLFSYLSIQISEASQNKIECYDISNIQGTNPVGALVTFVNGEQRVDLYRKFKIRSLNTPNDFQMHQEMMRRRLTNYFNNSSDECFSKLPDLFIIDGGKGQLSAIKEVFDEFNLSTHNLCAIAKREEIIYMLNEGEDKLENKFVEIKISKRSESLKLVQRIRDESHRFGITFHKKLRSNAMTK